MDRFVIRLLHPGPAIDVITCIGHLNRSNGILNQTAFDRLGVIELRPHNRYKLKVAKTLRWRPQGPVMQFFRERVMADFFAGGFEAWEISLAGVIAAARQGGLAGALELLAENQPVVGHAYETLHMLGAAAKIAGGSGAAQSSLNSIRIVQVDWGSVRSGHSGIFKGYNLIIGEGANVYTIESTFGEILNWKPDWLITRDLLFAAGVERLDQLKFQKYTGKEGKVVPTGMIHGGARYVPAAVLERKETTAAALLDYKCMREGCGNVFKATGTTTTDMRCVNGTKVGCQSTKVVRVKLAYKAVGEGGAMKIKLSREAEPL